MRNARFWMYVNRDFVKITLKPNQQLKWGFRKPTDEGYHAEYYIWEHQGNRLVEDLYTESRDCDGKGSSHDVYEFDLFAAKVEFGRVTNDEIGPLLPRPDWQRVRSSQRDYSAEAMGY
jgi:hypothetical protein